MKVRMDILVHLNVPDGYDLDNIMEWFEDWDKADFLDMIDGSAEYEILDDDEDYWEVE